MKSYSDGPMRWVRILPFVVGVAALAGCAKTIPAPRADLKDSSLRVTEIHFDPSPSQGSVEFIEVTNVGANPVDLSGWQVTGAGRVSLPAKTMLQAGQALVVCENHAAFKQAFGQDVVPVAVFAGKLKRKGETVRVKDPVGKVVDEVSYDVSDPKVQEASNTGRSIHRSAFTGAANAIWTAAAPTPGKQNAQH